MGLCADEVVDRVTWRRKMKTTTCNEETENMIINQYTDERLAATNYLDCNVIL